MVPAVVAAIGFTLAAGFNDGGNLLAVAASSRTIAPGVACLLIVAGVLAGPFVFGTAVAHTTGAGIADFGALGARSLFAAIAGALVAVALAYAGGVPTSLSAALFASMVGSLAVGPQAGSIRWSGIERVAFTMSLSIVAGAAVGAAAYWLIAFILERVHRPVGERIVRLQYLTVLLLSMGYGANDLEKSAGILAATVPARVFVVPLWALGLAAAGFAAGMIVGGIRVAKTVGGKLFAIRPQHALAAETAAAATVISAALMGGPLSTTDTSASSLVGVGAATNRRAIRWQAVRAIVTAWAITVPVALVAGALVDAALRAL